MRKILSLILALFICINITAYAENTALKISCTQNDTGYSVSVSISGNPGICAGSFEIEYDSTAFKISDLVSEEVIGNAMAVVNENFKENQAKVTFMSLSPISADGEVISFNISPETESAYTKIEIKNLLLADANENQIVCDVFNAEIGEKTEPKEELPETSEDIVSDIHINTGSSGGSKKTDKSTKQEYTFEQRIADVILLQIDNCYASAYGVRKSIDENNDKVVPYISHDRTLVPLRFIAETLGADVLWENGWNGCVIKKSDKEIKITFGSNEFTVNGKTIIYDAPIEVVEERTMVPIRLISEELDCNVYWQNKNRAVVISPLTNPWKESAQTEKTALLKMLELIKK
ncbi:MAG: hypothetical protein IKW59_02935 [Clostridia bacterium]|nr:hypothetical protein [Clostridia bacterium]